MKNNILKLLNFFNVRPDKNQLWILFSIFLYGILFTYISPAIVKNIITELPAEWIAFESLFMSIAGLIIGVIWKKKTRSFVIKYFTFFAIAESIIGCALGWYLCFIKYNVWIFAITSLIYTSFITVFVSKCTMAFKSVLWNNQEREIYDNNTAIVSGLVCIIGFFSALCFMPSLKTALFIWAICCIIDDIGWIVVYLKNKSIIYPLVQK